MTELRRHGIVLRGGGVVLRPMTEHDWPLLYRWNNRPEVLALAEEDPVAGYDIESLRALYGGVSQTAYCFIIKAQGREVGECWLQRMNLERILRAFPDADLRRIDITIGEPSWWGRGVGSTAIGLLVRFGYERERCDAIFAITGLSNERSIRAFARCGFRPCAETEGGDPRTRDLLLRRSEWEFGR
jgi:aminoglycoside 6'-N-acetyltransferase